MHVKRIAQAMVLVLVLKHTARNESNRYVLVDLQCIITSLTVARFCSLSE